MTISPDIEEQNYVKQMRSVDPSYLPLYDPDPWSEGYLYVGDVGVIESGAFRPLFNVTMKATHRRNGGGVPENFEPIPFSTTSDTCTRDNPSVIKKFDPCYGDTRLKWTREHDQITDDVDASETNEGHHPSISYKFTKSTPEASYVLLSMADVEETVLVESQVEVWKHYMEKHHKHWLKFIRKKWLDPNFKAEEIILLCGFIKTSRWIIATLPKEGEYQLDVEDTPVGMRPTLKYGTKTVSEGVRYGQDTADSDREIMQYFAQLAGLRVPDSRQPIRKRCLFITGLRMEKDFWLPKRIVAAAKPQEPSSTDRGHDSESKGSRLAPSSEASRSQACPLATRKLQEPHFGDADGVGASFSHTLASHWLRPQTCGGLQPSRRCKSAIKPPVIRHIQNTNSAAATHPQIRPSSLLPMSLHHLSQPLYYLPPTSETSLFPDIPVAAF